MSQLRVPFPVRPPAQVVQAETPGVQSLTALAVGVVVVAGLYFGRDVLIPVMLAVLLSFVLAPIVDLLRRLRLGRVPAVLLSVVLALSVILSLGGVIGTQLASLAGDMPRYQATIEHKVEAVSDLVGARIGALFRPARHQLRSSANQPGAPGHAASPAEATEGEAAAVPVEIRQPAPTTVSIAERIVSPVLSPLATTGLVLIVAIFILLQQEDLRDRLIRLFGSNDLHRTTTAIADAARRLGRYFLTQILINAAFGAVIGTGFALIGLPNWVLWGILAALLRFVPYIGVWIAAAPAVVLAAAVAPGWSLALWTLGLLLGAELIAGQVVEPLLYGRSTGLSPFAVVVSAIFWSWLWGPIGLILSTPLTLCLVVLGRHVDRLEFLEVALGDRPALTPVQNFYQRMLAGDPDEALEQAETLLRDMSLSAYYDDVVLKGLQLATNDALRGVLTAVQLERIQAAMQELLDGLEDREDSESVAQEPADQASAGAAVSAEWRAAHPVLCVAGRGPLDEAASAILAQILGKRGLDARVVPHEAASRAGIATLEVAGVAVVCVCYLDPQGGVPSGVRYLLRRLRQKLPQATIILGLSPQPDAATRSEGGGQVRGADFHAATLREAVGAGVHAATQAGAEQIVIAD